MTIIYNMSYIGGIYMKNDLIIRFLTPFIIFLLLVLLAVFYL